MFGSFHQRFTTCCGVNKMKVIGVNKMKVIHMTYPQAVYNNGGKKGFTGKNCCFSSFLKEKHLFSVDNSVHSVHKSVRNIKIVNRLCGMFSSVDRILFQTCFANLQFALLYLYGKI